MFALASPRLVAALDDSYLLKVLGIILDVCLIYNAFALIWGHCLN